MQITESDQTIRAIDAKRLQVLPGSAGFLVCAAGYAGNGRVWERTIYRGDSDEFHHRRAAAERLISIPAAPKASALGGAQ